MATLALALAACGGKTSGAAGDPGSTDGGSAESSATGSPSPSGHDLATGRHDLKIIVQAALRATASGQEYVCVAGECRLWNVSWSKGGRVYDVAYPAEKAGQSGLEVRHEPGRVLARAAQGVDNRCWWPAEPRLLAQFSRPVLPQVEVLRSAHVTGMSGGVLHGTVAARPLLQMLGSDTSLSREGLMAPTAMTTAAQSAFVPNGVKVTVDVAKTIRSLGQSPKNGSWTWEINVTPLPSAVPAIPSTRVIRVGRTDPGWASALQRCTAQHP